MIEKKNFLNIVIVSVLLSLISANYVLASDCFTLPFKQITIDGYFYDWADIPAVIEDHEGDTTSKNSDWIDLYVARDNNFIYIRFKLANDLGTNPNLDVNVRISCKGNIAYSLAGHLVSDSMYNHTDIADSYGSTDLHRYPDSYIARGSKDIEYKIPISDIPCGISWTSISAWSLDDDSDYNVYVCNDFPKTEFTGWWYDSSAPGTGFSIEFNNEDHWFLTWYVYDQNGLPCWYTASGEMANSTNFNGNLLKWSGWPWGESYVAPVSEKVGSIHGNFVNSEQQKITLTWELDEIGSGVLNLINFMQDMVNGQPDSRDLTGWWYDPAYDGMGFFIEARGETLFMAWYKYGDEGSPMWLTSTGSLPDGASVYNGTFSFWRNGQIPGGAYQQPEEIKDQGNINLTIINSSKATLVINNSTILNLKRFNF